jgi:hypothetical protein
LIIVSEVNVKDEFSAEGSECALSDSLLVPWLTEIEMMEWTEEGEREYVTRAV